MIIDGLNERRLLGPTVAEAVGNVSDETLVRSCTLPLNAVPGAGRLHIIAAWQCPGNYLQKQYPVARVLPDLHFRNVPFQAQP